MPQGKCKNCNRLIYDTEKLDQIPRTVECQHCHHVNIISRASRGLKPERRVRVSEVRKPKPRTIEPAPRTEVTPEPIEPVPGEPAEGVE